MGKHKKALKKLKKLLQASEIFLLANGKNHAHTKVANKISVNGECGDLVMHGLSGRSGHIRPLTGEVLREAQIIERAGMRMSFD